MRANQQTVPAIDLLCDEGGNSRSCSVAIQTFSSYLLLMSFEVPKLKLERRRAQNRKAANRCRTKRKMEEEELRKVCLCACLHMSVCLSVGIIIDLPYHTVELFITVLSPLPSSYSLSSL